MACRKLLCMCVTNVIRLNVVVLSSANHRLLHYCRSKLILQSIGNNCAYDVLELGSDDWGDVFKGNWAKDSVLELR